MLTAERLDELLRAQEERQSEVERMYRAAIDRMTPAEKIARSVALTNWTRWNIGRIIQHETGPLPKEELNLRIALYLYGENPTMKQIIEELLERVRTR